MGLVIALVAAAVHFLYLYTARTPFLLRVTAQSDVLRNFRDQTRLARLDSDKLICAFRLRGYVLFASAVSILREVKRSVLVRDKSGRGAVVSLQQRQLDQPLERKASSSSLRKLAAALTSAASSAPLRSEAAASSRADDQGGPPLLQAATTRFVIFDFEQVICECGRIETL